MTDENIARKLRSLLELSRRGEPNERDTAQKMLKRLMEKHGISSISDIDPENKSLHEFPCSGEFERTLLMQTRYRVTNRKDTAYWKVEGKKRIALELTQFEAIEVARLYEHYKAEWKREVKVFFRAFIQKNQIFGDGTPSADELTDEDMAELKRVMQMALAIKKNPAFHQLAEDATS